MSKKHYKNVKLNPLPERELEIIGEITAEKMALMREKALNKLKANLEVSGFRKGNVPDAIAISKIGEMALLEEAAEIALSEEYPNILEENKIDAIGRPEITITKIAPGNDLEFKVKTSLLPEVKLSDYKKISKKLIADENSSLDASDAEIDDVLKNIQKNIAHQKMHEDLGIDEHSHDHAEIKDEDLPPIDEAFIKGLGDFKDLSDLRSKIKENIIKEKELKEKDKKRTEILEKIMTDSKIELPKIIIEGELEKMLAQFKDDIARSGISYEDYLKHIKKTEEEIKNEWKDTAVKRAKSQVILNTIAKDEGIAAKEEDVKKEMEHILAHYKDADRFRVRMYVETFLTNELVFQFLESQK
jgi:FKBP-type peptidyl-prolyl cis-trans isomerase (trigger factor)